MIETVDLRKMVLNVFREWKVLLLVTTISCGIGVFIALTKQIEFESRITILPEKGSAALNSGASGLLQQFGLSLPNPSDYSIQPVNYKYIFSGIRFQKALIESKIILETGDEVTFEKYVDSVRSRGFFYYVLNWPVPPIDKTVDSVVYEFYQISEKEARIIEELEHRLTISIDEITGIISIKGKMPDPVASTNLVINAKDELNDYLQEISTVRSRRNLDFINSELGRAEGRFLAKQKELADFISSNKFISSESVKYKRQNLEQQYQLLSEIYSNLNQQKSQAEIELNKSLDSFIVLTDAVIPREKSEPKRKRIVFMFFMMGVFISLICIFFRHHRKKLKNHLDSFRDDLRSSG